MTNVVKHPADYKGAVRHNGPVSPHMQFAVARWHMMKAFENWLSLQPPDVGVEDEINATASAMRQLSRINDDPA